MQRKHESSLAFLFWVRSRRGIDNVLGRSISSPFLWSQDKIPVGWAWGVRGQVTEDAEVKIQTAAGGACNRLAEI